MNDFVRTYGPAHRREFLSHFFSLASQFEKVSLINTNFYPFIGDMTDKSILHMAYIFADFRCRMLGDGRRNSAIALAIGETCALHLPDGRIEDQETARKNVADALIFAKQHELFGAHSAPTPQNWDNFRQKAEVIARYPNLPAVCPLLVVANTEITNELSVALLWYLSSVSIEDIRKITIQLVTISYVAAAKRGTLGDQAQAKIINSIREELGVNITLPDELIAMTYRYFMLGLDETNAEETFNILTTNIPDIALRLTLTLQQSSWSGLTIYCLIKESILLYPDFQWYAVEVITEGQMTRWFAANTAINNNPYYGFKKDLGNAKSTNYKGPGYVAKELLIKIKGDLPLRQYQGLRGAIPGKARLDQLIEAYVARRNEAGDAVQNEEPADFRAAFLAARAING